MKRSTNASKLAKIRSGEITKRQIGGAANQKTYENKGGKFTITETSKKFEEAGVAKKKRNYVMYSSKLGTEKEQNLTLFQPAVKPRNNEKIVQTKKKVEYKDNYQYHETKNIKDKDPKKVSVVTHRRKGDIVGGSYETKTFQKTLKTDSGKGPKLYSSQTTKTTTRKNVSGKPTKTTTTTQRSFTASKTLPSLSKTVKKEVKKFSSNTNLRRAPKKPAPTSAKTKTTTTRTTTTRTTTKSTVPRAQSAGRGRRH